MNIVGYEDRLLSKLIFECITGLRKECALLERLNECSSHLRAPATLIKLLTVFSPAVATYVATSNVMLSFGVMVAAWMLGCHKIVCRGALKRFLKGGIEDAATCYVQVDNEDDISEYKREVAKDFIIRYVCG